MFVIVFFSDHVILLQFCDIRELETFIVRPEHYLSTFFRFFLFMQLTPFIVEKKGPIFYLLKLTFFDLYHSKPTTIKKSFERQTLNFNELFI